MQWMEINLTKNKNVMDQYEDGEVVFMCYGKFDGQLGDSTWKKRVDESSIIRSYNVKGLLYPTKALQCSNSAREGE